MILNTRHTGLVVRNLQKSLQFYEALGLKIWKREIETGPYIDTVVGIKDVIVEWAKLKAPDGSVVELLQYHSHPENTPALRSPANRLGCSHVSFTVKNAQVAASLFQEFGGECIAVPVSNPTNEVKVCYCYDPDGILIEIVEESE